MSQNITVNTINADVVNVDVLNVGDVDGGGSTQEDITVDEISLSDLKINNIGNGLLYNYHGTTYTMPRPSVANYFIQRQTYSPGFAIEDSFYGMHVAMSQNYIAVVYRTADDFAVMIYRFNDILAISEVQRIEIYGAYFANLEFSKDSRYLAISDFTKIYIYFREDISFELVDTIDGVGYSSYGESIAFAPDNTLYTTGTVDEANSGAVFVYQKSNNKYSKVASVGNITAMDDIIAVSNDLLVIGNRNYVMKEEVEYEGEIYTNETEVGGVLVYDITNILLQTIMAPEPLYNGLFGETLALSPCGKYLAICATTEKTNDGNHTSVFVYRRENSGFVLFDTVISCGGTLGTNFGLTLSISIDGKYLFVGDERLSLAEDQINAVYVFYRTDKYRQISKVIATENKSSYSIATSFNGTKLLIGDSSDNNNKGRIYTYNIADIAIDILNNEVDDTDGAEYTLSDYTNLLVKNKATAGDYTVTLSPNLIDGFNVIITNTIGSPGNLIFDQTIQNYTPSEFTTGLVVKLLYNAETNLWYRM